MINMAFTFSRFFVIGAAVTLGAATVIIAIDQVWRRWGKRES